MEVRAFVARLTANVADHLPANDALALADGRIIQVGVERVVPAAVVDQHRRQVQAERSREADGARGDRAHRGADGCLDADPVPRNARVVRTGGRSEWINDQPLDGPIQAAEIRRRDRTGGCGRHAARLGVAARALESFDPIVERPLVAVETRQPLLRLARVAARLPQIRLPRVLEGEIAAQLIGALAPPPAQCFSGIDEQLALPRHAVAELVHVIGEQAILATDEVEILVARQEIAKALRREQHLPAIQGAALVDVYQAPLQHRALFEQRILRDQQIDGDLVDLAAESCDLAVQLIDDAVGRLLL